MNTGNQNPRTSGRGVVNDKTEAQPEALRLAMALEESIPGYPVPTLLESESSAELRRQHAHIAQLEAANKEWSDKTDWVQQSVQPRELGFHRADVLRYRIAQLEAELIQQTNRAASAEQQVLALTQSALAALEGRDE